MSSSSSRLKQRVLDVQSRVLKRLSHGSPTSENGNGAGSGTVAATSGSGHTATTTTKGTETTMTGKETRPASQASTPDKERKGIFNGSLRGRGRKDSACSTKERVVIQKSPSAVSLASSSTRRRIAAAVAVVERRSCDTMPLQREGKEVEEEGMLEEITEEKPKMRQEEEKEGYDHDAPVPTTEPSPSPARPSPSPSLQEEPDTRGEEEEEVKEETVGVGFGSSEEATSGPATPPASVETIATPTSQPTPTKEEAEEAVNSLPELAQEAPASTIEDGKLLIHPAPVHPVLPHIQTEIRRLSAVSSPSPTSPASPTTTLPITPSTLVSSLPARIKTSGSIRRSFHDKLDLDEAIANHLRRDSQKKRKQSLLPGGHQEFIDELLTPPVAVPEEEEESVFYSGSETAPSMVKRKVWVKKGPAGSATAVMIGEEDLVDDARDVIMRRYNNTMAKQWDAPDVTLWLPPRGKGQYRTNERERLHGRLLSPDETLSVAIDNYFPNGVQKADDALIIELPRVTPRPSPRAGMFSGAYHPEEQDYFTPHPATGQNATPGSTGTRTSAHGGGAITILATGHAPDLPSPNNLPQPGRPRPSRRTTVTPIQYNTDQTRGPIRLKPQSRPPVPPPPPLESHPDDPSDLDPEPHSISPSAIPLPPTKPSTPITTTTTTADPKSPTSNTLRSPTSPPSSPPRGNIKSSSTALQLTTMPSASTSSPEASTVPPIKVLIVEDNIINLRLLEAFMRRLGVRWESAINGKIAVDKWRAGGFHLVLMDIQLPVMNGLEATREIRRLEKVNRIGSFSEGGSCVIAPRSLEERGEMEEPEYPTEAEKRERKELNLDLGEMKEEIEGERGRYKMSIPEEDRLPDSVLLRSPVIIVALTASSLQSDRHEAYAAGCNDFLTKVRFIPCTARFAPAPASGRWCLCDAIDGTPLYLWG